MRISGGGPGDCITERTIHYPRDMGCDHVVFENDDESYTCLQSCPVGYYERTDSESTRQGRITEGHPKGLSFLILFLNLVLFSQTSSIMSDYIKKGTRKRSFNSGMQAMS